MPNTRSFEKFIPFTTDYGFKVTFGNEHNTLFLRRAIQAMTGLERPIKKLTFEKNTKEAPTIHGRHIVYDLTCRLDNGEIAIVEMQLGRFPFMIKRLEYYATARMTPFVKKGKWKFKGIPRIYTIAIMTHSLFNDPDYHRVACLYDKKHRLIDDSLQFIFVELDKFAKTPETCTTELDKLIYTMKSLPLVKEKGEMPEFMQEEWLASAIKELDSANLTPEARADLEIAIARETVNLYGAEQWSEFVEQRGRQEGRAQGRAEGRAEGAIETLRKNIRQIMINFPEWSDQQISEVFQVDVEFVRGVRITD
jgi:predicted transposase/invertase (TIGR01784 family)